MKPIPLILNFLLLLQTFPIFSQIDSTLLDNYLPVKENNLWGYIDQTGNIMIPPQFQFVGKFSKDGFAIAQKNGKLGFINRQGKTVVPFKYTKINYLRSDIFAVKAKKWGLFHKIKGQILPTEYDTIQAIYLVDNRKIIRQVMLCKKDSKIGAINVEGKILVEPQYDSLAFHTVQKDFLLSFNNNKMGLIHLDNGEFIPAQYDKISFLPFDYVQVYQNHKAGLYNNLGEKIIRCDYEYLQFYERTRGKFILLDKQGYKGIYNIPQKRVIISCDTEFTSVRDVESNDTTFKIFQARGLAGTTAIDENGKQLLPIGKYDQLKHEKIGVIYLKRGEVWGIYFQKNQRLLKPQFQNISSFVTNLALVTKNSSWGIINIHGDILVPPLYHQKQLKITRNSIRIYTKNGVENLVLDDNAKVIDRFRLRQLRSIKINDMPDFDFSLNGDERQNLLVNRRNNNRNNDPQPPTIDSTRNNTPSPVPSSNIRRIRMGNHIWQYLILENGWKLYDSTAQDYTTRAYIAIEVNDSLNLSKAIIKRQDGNQLGHLYHNQTAKILHKGIYKLNKILEDFEKGAIAQLEARQIWNKGDSLSPFRNEKIYFEYLRKDGSRLETVNFLKNGKNEKSKDIVYNLPFEENLSKFATTAQWEIKTEFNDAGIIVSEDINVQKVDNWGFINRQGKVVVEPKYQTLEYPNEAGLIKLGKGKKLGIVDTLGKIILAEKYKSIDFVEAYELLVVKKGRKYGLNQYNGTELLDSKYDFIDKEFTRDFAIIVEKNKYGLINTQGKIVLEPQYDEILNFDSQGFARIRMGDKWGLLDTKLKVVLEPTYHKIERFDFKGFAKVRMQDNTGENSPWDVGIINKYGQEIVAPIQDSVAYLNNSEYTVFRTIESLDKENFGIIDKTGKLLIPYQFQNIRPFHNGIAAAQRNKFWGFIDTTSNYVIQPIYTSVNDFKEGIARVSVKRKYGYVNKKGNLVFPCELSYAEDAEGGVCRVRKNEKHGILDTQGKWIIEPKYDEILPFDEEAQAIVKIKDKTGFYYGIIDKTGTEIIPCKYQELGRFYRGLAKVKIKDTYNFIDRQGSYFFQVFFEDILNFSEDLAGFKQEGKWGFINSQGKVIIKPQYNKVNSFMNGFARVLTSKRKLIYIDKNGKEYKNLPQEVVWFNRDIYLQVKPFKEGLAAAETSIGKWRYINHKGGKPFSGLFLEASNFYNGYAKVKTQAHKIYYINKKGKLFEALPKEVVWKDVEEEARQKKLQELEIKKNEEEVLEIIKPMISSQTFKEGSLYGVVNQYGFVELNAKYNFLSQESENKRVARKNYLYGMTNIRGKKIMPPNCEQIQYIGQDVFRIEEGNKLGYWNYKKGWIWKIRE